MLEPVDTFCHWAVAGQGLVIRLRILLLFVVCAVAAT
jgi:hypothetical protein